MTLIEKIVFGDLPWLNFVIGIFSVFLCVFDIIELHYIIRKWNMQNPKASAIINGIFYTVCAVFNILFAFIEISIWVNALLG